MIKQTIGKLCDLFAHEQLVEPFLWNFIYPVNGTSKLAVDGRCGVCVIAQVDCSEDAVLEVVGMRQRPERGLTGEGD